jgi:hypothetical protein
MGTETIYHECALPTDHPEYRTQDYCRGCQVWRALTSPTDRLPNVHHTSGDEFCTVIGCEICP